MTKWKVLQLPSNGSFDHEADTREAALVLVLSRLEEATACAILLEEAMFGKAYFTERSNINVQPS